MTTPPKPPSPLRIAVRAMVLGISLGMACFILNTLLVSQLAVLLGATGDLGFMARVLEVALRALPSCFVAPVVAYGAGLMLTGPRWLIVVMQNISAQVTAAAVMAVPVGIEVYLSSYELWFLGGSLAVGVALSGWAMKRGQTTAERREQAVAAPPPPSLASIDFSKVKESAAAAAAPEAATPASPSAAAPVAPASETAAPAAPAAPASDKPGQG